MSKQLRVLVIEDTVTLIGYMEKRLKQYGVSYEIAMWYSKAEELIRAGGDYDLVLLDHRMPLNDPGCTNESDFDKHCDSLRNVGYGLLPLIKEFLPNAVIIGTSSMSSEIRGYEMPERTMVKHCVWTELPVIIEEFKK